MDRKQKRITHARRILVGEVLGPRKEKVRLKPTGRLEEKY